MSVATSRTSSFNKDPDAVLDYGADWTDWLALSDDEDVLTSSEWVFPDDLTADDLTLDDDSFTSTTTTAWLSKGVLGQKYQLVNRVTTAQGRTEDRTLTFTIRQH